MLSIKEAAVLLGISVSRLRRWIETGEVAVYQPKGCDPVISPKEVDRILNTVKQP